ncbi:MAG: cupin domain-containing protein [Halioglobus sp.]|nr:cupin domain-containing protein [Halioglobus sp.]
MKTWSQDLAVEKSKAVLRTKELEIARLVLPAGKSLKEHQVTGPIVLQCIEGSTDVTAMGVSQRLHPGQLLYLAPAEPHALTAITDSIILLTIIFK